MGKILGLSFRLEKSVEKHCDTEFFASPSFEAMDNSIGFGAERNI